MTLAEQWNARAGRCIFADRLDRYGLPEGGWAVPTLTLTDDRDNRRVRLCVGTHRRSGDRMQCASIYIDVYDKRRVMAEDLDQVPAEALARLLARLDEFEDHRSDRLEHHMPMLTFN